jgi:hypothetical protein
MSTEVCFIGFLKRHYESKACLLFIKDKSISNLVSLKILNTQGDPYLT